MIDIKAETPAALRLAAEFLVSHAILVEAMEGAGQIAPVASPAAPTPAAPPAPTPSNVVPLVPAPPVPVAPVASTVAPSVVPVASVPPVPVVSTPTAPIPSVAPVATAPVAPSVTAPPSAPELDRSGMPWDARIHQKGKSQKKDGTWKIQKGIDPAVVAAVTQENHARMINTPAAGASPAPVSLPATQTPIIPPIPTTPPGPSASEDEEIETSEAQARAPIPVPPIPVPPIPGATAQAPVIPPVPVHVPPAPVLGVPNVPQPAVLPAVSDYRALVQKISKARAENKLSQEQLSQALQAAGAPSLQLLGSMSHLVPVVDTFIDAAIASA